MKLSNDFILYKTERDTILVPTGKANFSGMVKGNKTLGAVLELLRNETTEGEIVSAMASRFDAPADVIEQDVKRALDKLREIGALDE